MSARAQHDDRTTCEECEVECPRLDPAELCAACLAKRDAAAKAIVAERDEGRLALATIGALTGALRCPSCWKLHTDDGRTPEEQAWAQRPHRTHLCVDDAAGKGCGATWTQPVADVVAGVERLREDVARLRAERLRLIEELPDA